MDQSTSRRLAAIARANAALERGDIEQANDVMVELGLVDVFVDAGGRKVYVMPPDIRDAVERRLNGEAS